MLHTNGRLIRHVPAELLTPALCLASAQANGRTLQDIPPPLRSLEVCVAALEDQPDMFPQVPPELAVAVTTALIDNDLDRAREQGAPRVPAPGRRRPWSDHDFVSRAPRRKRVE